MSRLTRFINPKSVAVIGGGWAANVVKQLEKFGFQGQIWPVHPTRKSVHGHSCVASVDDLPGPPDAAFIGVNRHQAIEVVRALSNQGAGGAICFASGFKEAQVDDLQAQLIMQAGDMPLLGPNCYGFLNYQSGAVLWPDEHGGTQTERGVAIIAQSSNIAINMTMQQRGLPIAQLFTLGNQAQLGVSDLIEHLLQSDGITAIGLYLEGIDKLAHFQKAALKAAAAEIPIVAIKVGKTEKSRMASLTHTASLTGGAAASSAMLKRLGIVEVDDIEVFLETLNLLHLQGPLSGNKVISVSCSGGEASMMADLADDGIDYADLNEHQQSQLAAILGDKVSLANPLDYHTYIWGDVPTMTACFKAVSEGPHDVCAFVLDVPRHDRCDPSGHQCAIDAIIKAAQDSKKPFCVISSINEGLSSLIIDQFIAANVVPLQGMKTALQALAASAEVRPRWAAMGELALGNISTDARTTQVLNEVDAKQALASFGVPTPKHFVYYQSNDLAELEAKLDYPAVAKALGIAHKTESNAVVVGIQNRQELEQAIKLMQQENGILVEQMVVDKVAELLVGVSVDETGVVLLSLGAGGIYTEIQNDVTHLALPTTRLEIQAAINTLRIAPILKGYRQQAGADYDQMLDAIQGIAKYALANLEHLLELDVNPLIVGQQGSVAVDALIKLGTSS